MSLHAHTNPEAEAQLAAQKRNSTILSLIIAILFCALLGSLFYMMKILIPVNTPEAMVSYQADVPDQIEPESKKIVQKVQKKPSPPASAAVQIMTTNAPSEISLPTAEVEVDTLSVDFGESESFGDGWGSGSGGSGNGSGAASFTPFGKSDPAGMSGSFYDFKQDNEKKVNKLGRFYIDYGNSASGRVARNGKFKEVFSKVVRRRFNASSMSKYYKSEKSLSFTHLVISEMNADAATKAFDVQNEVQPSGWAIVYEAELNPSEEGYYRFVGRFDDVLLVYVGARLILDGSYSDLGGDMRKGEVVPGQSLINVPMRASRYIRIKKGTKLRIVIGEVPGGLMGGGLFIQKKGETYKKNSDGQPILPPFTTEPLREEDKNRLRDMAYPIEVDKVPVFAPLKK